MRKIVVTGASRGLGRALVDAFIADGHQVAGCARDASAISALRDSAGGDGHLFEAVDVSDDGAVGVFSEAVHAHFGAPDLLINNAGIINENAPLWEVPADDFHRVIDVNINGVFHGIRHFAPMMIEAGSGVIANLSSGWGRSVSPEVAPYCASKWAVEGLSKALAAELPPGMASVPVNPGVIDTDMLRSAFGDGAAMNEKAAAWATRAAPFFLALGPRDNGQSVTV